VRSRTPGLARKNAKHLPFPRNVLPSRQITLSVTMRVSSCAAGLGFSSERDPATVGVEFSGTALPKAKEPGQAGGYTHNPSEESLISPRPFLPAVAW
jgi:hypothetical protein